MKKFFKRIMSTILAATAFASFALTAGAETNINIDDMLLNDGFELVSEERYTDSETGLFFVDKTYVKKNTTEATTQDYAPFGMNVSKTRDIYETPTSSSGDRLYTMHVSGEFRTANVNDMRVYNAQAWTQIFKGSSLNYQEMKFAWENDCGSNFLGGHVYAYIEYVIRVDFPNGTRSDLKLKVNVDVMGTVTVET